MTIINIEGLGEVEIQGDTPTPEESRIILKAVEAKKQEKIAQDLPSLAETYVTESNLSSGLTPEEVAEQDQALGNYLKSPEFFRLVAEIGGATAGSILTGGLALPAAAVAARAGMLARPFLAKLAKSTAGAAAGGGTAAGAASVTFDPKDDVLKEVVRGATEAAIGEAVGAPIAIKIGQGLTKVLGPKIDLLKGAEEAESIIKEQSAKIKTNPNLYDTELQKAAGDAQLTIGLKADNFL